MKRNCTLILLLFLINNCWSQTLSKFFKEIDLQSSSSISELKNLKEIESITEFYYGGMLGTKVKSLSDLNVIDLPINLKKYENGRLISASRFEKLIPVDSISIEYCNDGQIKKTSRQSEQMHNETEYFYNSDRLLDSIKITMVDVMNNDSQSQIEYFTYAYKDGLYYRENKNINDNMLHSSSVKVYDSKKREISRSFEYGGIKRVSSYTYGQKDTLQVVTQKNTENGKVKTVVIDYLNTKGKKVKTEVKNKSNKIVTELKYTYADDKIEINSITYDSPKKGLSTKAYQLFTGDDLPLIDDNIGNYRRRSEYEYDQYGNWTLHTEYNAKYEGGTIQPEYIYAIRLQQIIYINK